MKPIQIMMMTAAASALLTGTALAATFESGTTCTSATDLGGHDKCLGPFSPSVNTIVTLPPDGILDYSSVTIPFGVTVTFTRNAANTPVTIRSFGNVKVEGVIDVSAGVNGSSATNSGTYGDGSTGDDGQPGTGGPGGFDGGFGGRAALYGGAAWQLGGSGKGPGGGQCGTNYNSSYPISGAGGSFGSSGASAWNNVALAGATYGQASLLPLIGGSGGGGGLAGSAFSGAGGGGGGGAILIAAGTATSPATITIGKAGSNPPNYAQILAAGGNGGNSSGGGCGGEGAGGSGGAIRLVADSIQNPDEYYHRLYTGGGGGGGGCWNGSKGGGVGRIRLEANTLGSGWYNSYHTPAFSWGGAPGHATVPNNPTLTIVSVTPTAGPDSGVAKTAPANPSGNADITFQTGTTTATVSLSAYYIPVGSTATVHVIPSSGAVRSSATSSSFAGSNTGTSTASATVTLSPGNNVLLATVTYQVTEVIAMSLPKFNGEYVAKIRVEGGMDGTSQVTYITASGKEYPANRAKG